MNQKQKDLLCKMLNGRARVIKEKLKKRFALASTNRYNIRHAVDDNPECLKELSGDQRRVYDSLTEHSKRLDKEQEDLTKRWDALIDAITADQEEAKKQKEDACTALSDALEDAILKVQFANNEEQAREIVNSLPSVRELLCE